MTDTLPSYSQLRDFPSSNYNNLDDIFENCFKYENTYRPVSVPIATRHGAKKYQRAGVFLLNKTVLQKSIQLIGSTCFPGFWSFSGVEWDSFVDSKPAVLDKCKVTVGVTWEPPKTTPFVEGEPFMVLPLKEEWKTMEDYANALKKKYRARYRKAKALLDDLTVHEVKDMKDSQCLHCSNMWQTALKGKMVALPKDLTHVFEWSKQLFGDRFTALMFEKDGEQIGFITLLKEGDKVFAMHIGCDHEDRFKGGYYSVFMYRAIQWAIDNGANSINLGRTAVEIKSTYGAVPIQNYFAIYAKSKTINAMAKQFVKKHTNPTFELRSPFKQPPS